MIPMRKFLLLFLLLAGALVLSLSPGCKKKTQYVYLDEDALSGPFATEPAAEMVIPRYNHNCILLANGKVLVVCGTLAGGKQKLRCAELYDPATGTFSAISSMQIDVNWLGSRHERMYASGICEMSGTSGRYYFICGFGPPEIYDADCNSFTAAPAPPDDGTYFTNGWDSLC